MTKEHGMTGKRNASKNDDEKKTSHIHIRCDSKLKSEAEKTAQENGKTLSQWITDLIKHNSKY